MCFYWAWILCTAEIRALPFGSITLSFWEIQVIHPTHITLIQEAVTYPAGRRVPFRIFENGRKASIRFRSGTANDNRIQRRIIFSRIRRARISLRLCVFFQRQSRNNGLHYRRTGIRNSRKFAGFYERFQHKTRTCF